jgi:hypothetical protein
MPELRDEIAELRELVRNLRTDVAVYRTEHQAREHFVSYKALWGMVAVLLAIFGLVTGWVDKRRADEDRRRDEQVQSMAKHFTEAMTVRPPWLSDWTKEMQAATQAPPPKPGPSPEDLREVERLRRLTRGR